MTPLHIQDINHEINTPHMTHEIHFHSQKRKSLNILSSITCSSTIAPTNMKENNHRGHLQLGYLKRNVLHQNCQIFNTLIDLTNTLSCEHKKVIVLCIPIKSLLTKTIGTK